MGLNSFGLEFDSVQKSLKSKKHGEHLERIEQILAKHAELVESCKDKRLPSYLGCNGHPTLAVASLDTSKKMLIPFPLLP